MNGYCVDEGSSTKCVCFSLYFGDECQYKQEELKVIQQVMTVSSNVAIIIIVSFYALFIANDVGILIKALITKQSYFYRKSIKYARYEKFKAKKALAVNIKF
jgi:hypothetical protein